MPLEKWAGLLGTGVDIAGKPVSGSVGGISIDSRTIAAGDAFFAIRGERFDGHDFVDAAVAGGAEVVVVASGWRGKVNEDRAVVRTADPLVALQTMAENYRGLFDIPVVGLTGTNGKTTTKEMIAEVLAQKYTLCKSKGNLNNHIGLPLSLMQIDAATEIAVMEMGMNQPGEIAALCRIARPSHGLVTNIGPGHIGYFSGIAAIAHEKTALYRALNADDLAFINRDDPYLAAAAGKVTAQKLTYGLGAGADVSAESLGSDDRGCAGFRLQGEVEVRLSVPGGYQVLNALAAAAVGVHFDISPHGIKTALERFRGVSERMELVPFRRSLIVLDVYNSNPGSLRPALETTAAIAGRRGGRFFVVFGDMLELGRESRKYHEEAGRLAADSGANRLFLFGPESAATAEAYRSSGGEWVGHYDDQARLARALADAIGPDDVVLIKGSRGMRMEAVMQILTELNQPDSGS